MIRVMNTAEYRINRKQLAVKTDKFKLWVITVKQPLFTYDLPSDYDLIAETPTIFSYLSWTSKELWKLSVKKAINSHLK